MKKRLSTSDESSHDTQSPISNAALADFLVQLAALYTSPVVGNPALASALRKLAESLRENFLPDLGDNLLYSDERPKQPSYDVELLKELDHGSIRQFISDATKTKAELLDLAVARFSIPRSQLKRMKVGDIRLAINSALLHESSIEILSEEAKRNGEKRSS